MSPADVLTAARAQAPSVRLARVRASLLLVPALAVLSFVLPSAPTYDPWAWIVWGREITQLDLMTTDGPSWKPLPVFFTTLFAPLGDIAPDLWLFVARLGALAGVPLAFHLARRLGAGTAGGVFAAAAYAVQPWTIRHGLLGNSEGLFVALLLAAVLLHAEGRRGWAFTAALGCALLRPEAWPFLGLYGAWRLWTAWREREAPAGERRRRAAGVLAGFASLPVLWLAPEWWGSGNPLRAADRAQQPNPDSPAFAANPALEILGQFARMLPPAAWIGLVVLVVVVWRSPHRRLLGWVTAGATAWVGLVAFMTSDGFAGNTRYLIPPAALAIVLAGAGAGTLLRRLPLAAAIVLAVVAAVTPAIPKFDDEWRLNRDQAQLLDALPATVAAAGGAAPIAACGGVTTGPYQVPALAWHLGIHTSEVTLRPRPTGTIFRARNFPDRPVTPSLRGFEGGELRTLAVQPRWRVLTTCPGIR